MKFKFSIDGKNIEGSLKAIRMKLVPISTRERLRRERFYRVVSKQLRAKFAGAENNEQTRAAMTAELERIKAGPLGRLLT